MLRRAGVNFLESEFDITFTDAHFKLVDILDSINFDFDEYEPVFVKFPSTEMSYIYQARRDALVEVGDLLLVPTGAQDSEVVFKVAEVASTFRELNINHTSLKQVKDVIERFKNVRPIVANLGSVHGIFFDEYLFEVSRKEKRKELLEQIEERAKVAKREEYFKNIAKTDSIMDRMIKELEDLGGF